MNVKNAKSKIKIGKILEWLGILACILIAWMLFLQRPATFLYFRAKCGKSPFLVVRNNALSSKFEIQSLDGPDTHFYEPGENGYLRSALAPDPMKTFQFGCAESDFEVFLTNAAAANMNAALEAQRENDKKAAVTFAKSIDNLYSVNSELLNQPSSYILNERGLTLYQVNASNQKVFVSMANANPCAVRTCTQVGMSNLGNSLITATGEEFVSVINGQIVIIGQQAGRSGLSNEELLGMAKRLEIYSKQTFEVLVNKSP